MTLPPTTRRKRRVLLLGFLILSLLALFSYFSFRETRHNGRPISSWIADYYHVDPNFRLRAREALFSLKPELLVPILIQRIERPPSRVAQWLAKSLSVNFRSRLPQRVQKWLGQTDPAIRDVMREEHLLEELGREARSALPLLVQRFATASHTAMKYFGLEEEMAWKPPVAFSALYGSLPQDDKLKSAVASIAGAGDFPHHFYARLILAQLENQPSAALVKSITSRIHATNDAAYKMSIAMTAVDYVQSRYAAETLGRLGAVASPSLPELLSVMRRTNAHARFQAAAAVYTLDPGSRGEALDVLLLPLRPRDAATSTTLPKDTQDPAQHPAVLRGSTHFVLGVTASPLHSLHALKSLQPPPIDATPAIQAVLHSPNTNVQTLAAIALAKIDPARIGEALPVLARNLSYDYGFSLLREIIEITTPALKDGDPATRRLAAHMLGRIGPGARSARATLVTVAAEDPDQGVRAAATAALKRLLKPRRKSP